MHMVCDSLLYNKLNRVLLCYISSISTIMSLIGEMSTGSYKVCLFKLLPLITFYLTCNFRGVNEISPRLDELIYCLQACENLLVLRGPKTDFSWDI